MRWSNPKIGDKRTIRRFALLPVRLSCGDTVWLRMYNCKQIFKKEDMEISDWATVYIF